MFETFVSWCTTLSIFPRNSNRPTKRQFPMVVRFESIIWTYCLESIYAFTFSQLTLELFVVCFSGWIFFQKLKQANQATISHGSSTCLHPFDVLHRENMFLFYFIRQRCLLFVGCFFSFRGHIQLPKLSIRNKFVMKMLSCTIIVVIMSNHIRRITLNLLCTVTCCAVQQIFFFSLQNFQFERSLLLKWYFAQSL